MVGIATTPQCAITGEFISQTFQALAFSQCTRGTLGMCSFRGFILGIFKIGNL